MQEARLSLSMLTEFVLKGLTQNLGPHGSVCVIKILCYQVHKHTKFVTQREVMRLLKGDIKTDILNSTYCSLSKEHFYTKTIFISYSYQKLQII